MSNEQFSTLIRRYFDAWNQKDLALLDRMADEIGTVDCISHMPGGPDTGTGPSGQRAFVRFVLESNPDFHITVDDLFIDGNIMALRGTMQGNNPETGAVESYVLLEIEHLRDGKIAESWSLSTPGKW